MKKTVPYRCGKRSIKNANGKKKIIITICIIIILVILISYMCEKNAKTEEQDIQTNTEEEENIMNTATVEDNTIPPEEIIETDYLPDKMGDYTVIGELVIDKIGVKKNILGVYTKTSLNLSVTKFHGPDINQPGNFCITGHNYPDMLKRLNELQIGDTFYIIGKEQKTKVTYQIYDIYTCDPTDLKCLDQNNDGMREVTLITCNPGGLTRLICKAKEI